jgi:chromosome segregation protein
VTPGESPHAEELGPEELGPEAPRPAAPASAAPEAPPPEELDGHNAFDALGAVSVGPDVARARLLALRLQGFKSFAERTVVEFGPGISAIVGPNGSGKSNLADALRWALGEQGRALRSRKSEDVIFAGSERRAALGMADVTLVLDNADGLLPVDYEVLEIGRRLYRSGENDYLLNRQRMRLRDLVDLLDAAHLADNAFLFIGQGMVDQALALRPEERRPLFEEVAGVRRHERRRRRAEEQLTEAEANIARVEDVLAELRPQARRLAIQAEQQANRLTAGEDLAAAILLGAHARWHAAASRVAAGGQRLDAARTAVDAALATLHAEEQVGASIAAGLEARSEREVERRATHDAARSLLTSLQLREARLSSELDAIARDRTRVEAERAAAQADLELRRREAARPTPSRDVALEERVAGAERILRDALEELAAVRAAGRARGDQIAVVRRAEAARQADLDGARRRLAEAERQLAEEAARSTTAAAVRSEREAAAAAARHALEEATRAEAETARLREAARAAAEAAEGRRRSADERATSEAGRVAALTGRLEALRTRLAEDETRTIARAARRRGGWRIDERLRVEVGSRPSVEAALGELARAYVVTDDAVGDLAAERGLLILGSAADRPERSVPEELRQALAAVGGDTVVGSLRGDTPSVVRRLLEPCVRVPDLASALAIRWALPAGWLAVVRDGSAVVTRDTVSFGRPDGVLERRAEVELLAEQVGAASSSAGAACAAADARAEEAAAAKAALERARAAETETAGLRRRAEEAERAAGRASEAATREAAWLAAQVERLETDAGRLREGLAALEAASTPIPTPRGGAAETTEDQPTGPADPGDAAAAIQAWETRVAELRASRDRLASHLAEEEARRRDAESARTRAEAGVAMGEERSARAERDLAALSDRERALLAEREELTGELADAVAREEASRAALDEVRQADAEDRRRLAAAEAAAAFARDGLRVAEERLRGAEVADLEARLGLDAIREQLLVELAGLGGLGLHALGVSGDVDDEAAALETALGAQGRRWATEAPVAEAPPPGRLAYLRRRYHELGAANPFAVEEYATLKVRLESLEAQHADLREAIARTRTLIDELNTLIADQFRATFRALETAFDERFRQLFGGGFARLSLTDPEDLSSTGVEIVARPPGKKAQALAMLSGGERALTAVALLFAMLEVRPVPFCVLDEVDAALDEANVGRFSEALRGLASRTQFIVITHNRGTIEVADALYGVTVGDDSVSRVISLRLEEAQAITEPRGGRAESLAS